MMKGPLRHETLVHLGHGISPMGASLVTDKRMWLSWYAEYRTEILRACAQDFPALRPPAWWVFDSWKYRERHPAEPVASWLVNIGEVTQEELDRAERQLRQQARREARRDAKPHPLAIPPRVPNPGQPAWRFDRPILGSLERRSLGFDE